MCLVDLPENNLGAWPRKEKALAKIEISEEQALFFRARPGHLGGEGAPDPATAARATLGAQSQQEGPALLALSQRTQGRPTATELKAAYLEAPRRLVRTWGQRDTVHLYDPEHWPHIVSARASWAPAGRRGAMPPQNLVDAAREILLTANRPITRRDLFLTLYFELSARGRGKVGLPWRRRSAFRRRAPAQAPFP
ncbi:MAG: winged helix DNA-binding domain-containing protein [Deltaproteobacteria bacterium]|nr:winged helix DNA-binding domain-containing protein [Deltaproteobacteria bacterium]